MVRLGRSILVLAATAACQAANPGAPVRLIVGTWGGDNAGLIGTDSTAHVHIGCTLGDANGPIRVDESGRFEATGLYNVDAYPISRGIYHPARFSGQIFGRTMVLTVVLTDTSRTLGPVTLTYGAEPRMGPCPICRVPMRQAAS